MGGCCGCVWRAAERRVALPGDAAEEIGRKAAALLTAAVGSALGAFTVSSAVRRTSSGPPAPLVAACCGWMTAVSAMAMVWLLCTRTLPPAVAAAWGLSVAAGAALATRIAAALASFDLVAAQALLDEAAVTGEGAADSDEMQLPSNAPAGPSAEPPEDTAVSEVALRAGYNGKKAGKVAKHVQKKHGGVDPGHRPMGAAWALKQVEGKDKPAIRLFTLESWLCYVINAEHRVVWFGHLDPFTHEGYARHIGVAQCLHVELLSLPPYIGTVYRAVDFRVDVTTLYSAGSL
eukprot:gene17016-30933_t